MRYYILTTVKFAKECIEFKKYGSTNSNWLSNIDIGDVVFLSQFNYQSQNIYGSFKVTMPLFYDKKIIFPSQKYYYRIKLEYGKLQFIDETDLYLNGINYKNINFSFKLISLLQQNKHLHSICLNEREGEFILETIKNYGNNLLPIDNKDYIPLYDKSKVDITFLADKNKLQNKSYFSSESDLEAYIILCLKNKNNITHKHLKGILNVYPKNDIDNSLTYNQFVFGNAYPSDIVILNKDNINILELKKTGLDKNMMSTIEKEIKKYCLYSLYSDRLEDGPKQINFVLIILKDKNNISFKKHLEDYFEKSLIEVSNLKKYNFMIVEYYIKGSQLLFGVL